MRIPAEDHIDGFLRRVAEAGIDVDLEVEGLVDRMNGISRRMKRGLEQTAAEHGLTPGDWGVMSVLRVRKGGKPSSPGELASELELSSGAMTSRLDKLEQAGHIRRLPDPDDRRGVLVELTQQGRDAWDSAASIQGRREAFFASALTKAEQRQLNNLLRKLMLAFEASEEKS